MLLSKGSETLGNTHTPTDFSDIKYQANEDHIAWLTLNRPAQMNAYSSLMTREIVAALDAYLQDDTQRVLVLTGEGRGFCAGGDISGSDPDHKALMASQLSHGREMRDGMHRVIQALHALDKPVIAMINGAAVAGGLTLALACDFRIASNTAKLGDTSGRFGLLPDEGGAWYFPRAMGMENALKMTLFAETYSGDDAVALGLASQSVPHEQLLSVTQEFAQRLAAQSPLAVRLAKKIMVRGQTQSLDQSLGDAALSVMVANPSEDVKEGIRAFFGKRAPNFTGK
ncbi:MAG: enoyl-CoA hydratase/carnithine racemase [Parvibaculaceae bacterium]|jgi:2-(1,2-epoxy-1,2-dihydrophenyl)acetyl-CoA isomerase